MNAVAVTSDTATLLNALSATFTSSTTVLAELMQNARRAGASRVEITHNEDAGTLSVADDGIGLDDFSLLLSIAKSGWEGEVKEQESPYGLGWISTLFACAEVEVVSRGQRLRAKTADLIALMPVALESVPDDGLTTITLRGQTIGEKYKLSSAVERYSRGFPLPVTFNGKAMLQPHARDESFVDIGIGHVNPDALEGGYALELYLQGLPIALSSDGRRARLRGYGHEIAPAVLHLDPAQFKGRMPDRDALIDPDAAAKRISAAMDDAVRRHLEDKVTSMPQDKFVERYGAQAAALGMRELLNAIPFVPGDWLVLYELHPTEISEDSEDGLETTNAAVSREDIAAKGLYDLGDWDKWDHESLRLPIAVYEAGGYQIASRALVPAWHWLHELITLLDESQFELQAGEVMGEEDLVVYGCGVRLVVVDALALNYLKPASARHSRLPASIGISQFYDAEQNRLYVRADDFCAYTAVRLVSDYANDGSFDEDERDQDARACQALVQSITEKDAATLLRAFLSEGLPYVRPELLKNRCFTVVMDADGVPSVSEVIDG